MKNAKITPLFPVWDNMEQWDVINHAPTAMQRATISNFSHFLLKEKAKPVTDGPHFCLGDGLTKEKWQFINKCIEDAQIENAIKADGATFIYSIKKSKAEALEYIKYGRTAVILLAPALFAASIVINNSIILSFTGG